MWNADYHFASEPPSDGIARRDIGTALNLMRLSPECSDFLFAIIQKPSFHF
jgi:hypothetical protein